jgi:glycosyltransferase involved in cell wall biosynthesis
MDPARPVRAATRVAITRADEARRPALTVAWVGPRPAWLQRDDAVAELVGIEFSDVAVATELVVVDRSAVGEIDGLRKSAPQSVIALDLTDEEDVELRPPELRRARAADVLLAGSRWELGEICRRLPSPLPRMAVVPRPLDLDWYAPEPVLAETKGRGRDLRRFRRFHRLAGPTVLFAGPYTASGGLDLLVEAVLRLREKMPDLRLAAIPHGPIDPRYRDRCEMRALGLGHHGIIEWDPPESEVPFWYGIAAVVCSPSREPASPEPAKRAAAAARPFVGSDLESFREHVDEGTTGNLVPVDEPAALEAALRRLLDAEDEQTRLGDAARRKAESDYSPRAAARALRHEWSSSLETRSSASRGG